ncbi:MAG: histidine phosphatase family protein [Gammaproteobacteria bacterium]|nr:histidine phosphatase family protein [Gammaproteobacteria bacterium]
MLYFVRHGQTDWNAAHRLQSHSDIPLNATGRAQAKAIAQLFTDNSVRFTVAASSPLQRASETAASILADSNVTAHPYPELIEISLGQYEGEHEEELRTKLGPAYDRWRQTYFETAAPGGESRADAINRVRHRLAGLAECAQTAPVLVVGHQAINMAMKSALSGLTDATSLKSFMQANNEIDVWQVAPARLIERLKV